MSIDKFVSVIIPTYGRSLMLKRAISSVVNQKYTSFEIIVVDDNSPESDHRKRTEACILNFDDIIYIKHEKNFGGCVARNTGIKRAKGAFIAFLDDDDEWEKDFLEKQLKRFDKDNVGAVYCNFFLNKMNGEFTYSKKIEFENFKGNVYGKLLSGWCPASTSLFIIKKKCFEICGFFDEQLESFQDYDMWLRISKKFEFNYSDEYLIIKHEHLSDQISLNPITRKNGLNVLKSKFTNILDNSDMCIFQETAEIFEKRIIYSNVIVCRQKGEFANAFKNIVEFSGHSKSDIKSIFKLIFIFVFGYKPIKLFHQLNSKKIETINE